MTCDLRTKIAHHVMREFHRQRMRFSTLPLVAGTLPGQPLTRSGIETAFTTVIRGRRNYAILTLQTVADALDCDVLVALRRRTPEIGATS